jgi:glycosyltransferase involved in cell wall biosynthesis
VPQISVIVPAGNAEATVGRTLAALAEQDFDGDFEVLLVDDASADATLAIAERAGVRVLRRDTPGGPAGARNSGVAASSAPLIAFTDADCVPTPGWLTAITAAFERADLVRGPIRPDPGVERGVFDRTLSVSEDSARFETANLAVRRDLFESLGGFETFGAAPGARGIRPGPGDGHFGEDVVFGWRARRLGARICFAHDALVHHAVFPRGPRGYIAERKRLRFFPALLTEVPEMGETLPLRIFLTERTALFDLGLVGLAGAVATRRPWLALAVAPYIQRHLSTDDVWRRSTFRENAAKVAADCVGAFALIRGSVAARRAVL